MTVDFRHVCTGAILLAALAGCNQGSSPTSPSPFPQPGEELVYAALGASDAIGVGGSVPCMPFVPCPDGTGYVQIIARQLATTHRASLTNLGIPAAVLSPRIQAIGNEYGSGIPANLIERQMPFVPRDSHVVTIFAGGNDINTIARAVEGGAGGADPRGYIVGQIDSFGAEYRQLLRGIRDRAPSARIVVANLPNFAGLPFTAGYPLVRRQVMQEIASGFSARVNASTNEGVRVVDLMCDPRAYQPGNYSSDGFHPSDPGYAFLAAEMIQAIRGTTYPPPRGSCQQMTLVPRL
jgi:lysophospholipase L1-like esterase